MCTIMNSVTVNFFEINTNIVCSIYIYIYTQQKCPDVFAFQDWIVRVKKIIVNEKVTWLYNQRKINLSKLILEWSSVVVDITSSGAKKIIYSYACTKLPLHLDTYLY